MIVSGVFFMTLPLNTNRSEKHLPLQTHAQLRTSFGVPHEDIYCRPQGLGRENRIYMAPFEWMFKRGLTCFLGQNYVVETLICCLDLHVICSGKATCIIGVDDNLFQ